MMQAVFGSCALRALLASLALMAVCQAGRLPSTLLARQALSTDSTVLEPTIPVPVGATTFTTRFENHAGSTEEVILFRLDYDVDVNADSPKDLVVTVGVAPESNAGFEDFLGLAIGNLTAWAATIDLTVANITTALMPTAASNLTLSTFEPVFLFDYQKITSKNSELPTPASGRKPPSIPIKSKDGPFDILIGTNEQGLGDGAVQRFSFVLTACIDLTKDLLQNTEWYARLQSTDGGEGSAKTFGAVGAVFDIFEGQGQTYQANGTIDDAEAQCPEGEYGTPGMCQSCTIFPLNCNSCNKETGACTTCTAGTFLIPAACGVICAACQPVENCVEFNNIPGTVRCPAGNTLAAPPACTACAQGFFLLDGLCVADPVATPSAEAFEGSNATLTFSNLDCLTVKSIQWGDGQTSTFQSGFAPSEPLPHIYEQPGNYTVQIAYICTCCSDKITIIRTATIEVMDVVPELKDVDLSVPVIMVGNGPISVNFTVVNEGREDLGSVVLHWGDNSDQINLALTRDPFTDIIASHTYLTAGEFDITITVKDDDGNLVMSKVTIHVLELPTVSPCTPGFWSNWQQVWSGDAGDDSRFSTRDGFPLSDVLLPPYSAGFTGKILIGDTNRGYGSATETSPGIYALSLSEAMTIFNEKGRDKRITLGQHLLAAWLNFLANADPEAPIPIIKEAIEWLQSQSGPVAGNDAAWVAPTTSGPRNGEAIKNDLDYYNNSI
ncbi:hypothetical protein DUNSADRAFT_5195 [Dunaliella salina]|uniref:PKD domain-containing protein n=1 Tax=Dunaliella salina TaxID=3046 RepID=A0ABQ7GQS6_DUNSA|nr:hypothetical protein DUNSADRAFT_5195 [Dunaliella salina]|eukprot:KAF5836966.1 hypothetical protein DUNSADRAFT_5195 [Dunaliella salina]